MRSVGNGAGELAGSAAVMEDSTVEPPQARWRLLADGVGQVRLRFRPALRRLHGRQKLIVFERSSGSTAVSLLGWDGDPYRGSASRAGRREGKCLQDPLGSSRSARVGQGAGRPAYGNLVYEKR
jgi:hypothetical protein